MDRNAIEHVLRELGIKNFTYSGDHVMTSCVLARFRVGDGHNSAHDSRPSAGVRITQGLSPYHCFACKEQSGLMEVVRKYGSLAIPKGLITREKIDELTEFIMMAEDESMIRPIDIHGMGLKNVEPVPDSLLKALGTRHGYFIERKISNYDIDLWKLGYAKTAMLKDKETGELKEKRVNRLLFPIMDRKGDIHYIQARAVDDEEVNEYNPKYRLYPASADKSNYLYGEHLITDETKILIVVEGQVDAINGNRALIEQGLFPIFVVVSITGSDLSDAQADKLIDFAEEIVDGLDNDSAGRLGSKKMKEKIMKRTLLSKLQYPEGIKDADELVTKNGSGAFVDIINERKLVAELELERFLKVGGSIG